MSIKNRMDIEKKQRGRNRERQEDLMASKKKLIESIDRVRQSRIQHEQDLLKKYAKNL